MDSRYAGDNQFLTRFQREARAVARLKDPGLVAVYDQGIDGQHPFLVMELVEGGTLRELLVERGPMPPHAVAAVLAPGARRSRGGPPRGAGAPRRQTGERVDLRRRRRQDRRLRVGARDRRGQDHLDQRHSGHRGIPVARAGQHRRRQPRQRCLRRRHPRLRAADRRHPVHRRHRAGGGVPADGPRRRPAQHGDRRCASAIRRAGAARDRTRPGRPLRRRRRHGVPNSRRSSTSWGCPTSGCPRRATPPSISPRRCTAAGSASTPPPPTPSSPAPPRQHTRELTRGPDDWQTDETGSRIITVSQGNSRVSS